MNSEFTIAVHSLVFLAHLPERMASSDCIAANVFTHPARIRKVMGCLRKAGYVSTREGSGGGYTLQCDPARVTLAELYRLMAWGSLQPSWCTGDPEMDCLVGSNMQETMNRIFCQAERHLEAYFDQITIAGILQQLHGSPVDLTKT